VCVDFRDGGGIGCGERFEQLSCLPFDLFEIRAIGQPTGLGAPA
jgi:hypothetical protein